MREITPRRILLLLIMMAFFIRILFLIKGASFYYGAGDHKYLNNDSFSYTQSFLNFVQKGVYSHNLNNPEAAFGRLPGYPVFWGFHYYIFGGKYVHTGVALTQIILDSIAVYLIFAIILAINYSFIVAFTGAGLYCFYPFIIVWTTIIGTEALASFLTLLFFYLLFTFRPGTTKIVVLGLCLALCFYVREYLGILIVAAFLYFYLTGNLRYFFKNSFLLGTIFLFLYLPWPIRNYLVAKKIILIKTTTAGYERYAADVNSCRSWIYCWSPDADLYLTKIAATQETDFIPAHVFTSTYDKQLFRQLVTKSRTCGSGFYFWKENKPYIGTNCNAEIERGFMQLKSNFIKERPFTYLFKVPLLSLKKSFFKNELTDLNLANGSLSIKSLLSPTLFTYRTILLLFGVMGCIWYIRSTEIKVLLFFFGFIYLFICFLLRQVEMRYLLQADVVFLIPAALFIGNLYVKLRKVKYDASFNLNP